MKGAAPETDLTDTERISTCSQRLEELSRVSQQALLYQRARLSAGAVFGAV